MPLQLQSFGNSKHWYYISGYLQIPGNQPKVLWRAVWFSGCLVVVLSNSSCQVNTELFVSEWYHDVRAMHIVFFERNYKKIKTSVTIQNCHWHNYLLKTTRQRCELTFYQTCSITTHKVLTWQFHSRRQFYRLTIWDLLVTNYRKEFKRKGRSLTVLRRLNCSSHLYMHSIFFN